MGPSYSFVLTARTRLLTLIRSFFIFFSIVFVVVPSTPDGDAASYLLYKCVVPLFLLPIFLLVLCFFIYLFFCLLLRMGRKSRANFSKLVFPFFFGCCCCCSRDTCFMLQPLRLSGVISFHHVVSCVCVLPINGYRVIKLHFRPISGQHIHKH